MVLTVFFVRHGESQANIDRIFANRVDYPARLTPAGMSQAESLAGQLEQRAVTHLYSSPLPRARQTAAVIGDRLGLQVVVSDALREYDVGDFEGMPYGGEHAWRWTEYERVDREWLSGNRLARLPGGESLADIETRFGAFMVSLVESHASIDRPVIVSHGGLYRVGFPAVFTSLPPEATRRYGIGHCDVIVGIFDQGEWRCREWAGTPISP